jgi:hypothetical protein
MELTKHQTALLNNLCDILYSGRITNSKSETRNLIDLLYEEDDLVYGLNKSELLEYVFDFVKKEWVNLYVQKADLKIRDMVPEPILNKNGYSEDHWRRFSLHIWLMANTDEVYAATIRDSTALALLYKEKESKQ